MARNGNAIDTLRKGGFRLDLPWPADTDSYRRFLDKVPDTPGVYAIVVGNRVCYIGKAQEQGIRNRLKKYTTAKKWGSTAETVRAGVENELNAGNEVRVFLLEPETRPHWLRDPHLPINLIEGIEAGLIQVLQPAWNKRGVERDEEREVIADS